jgi:hydroxymethylpyrimidine pyrophosphatase-like HAD family hydrolase
LFAEEREDMDPLLAALPAGARALITPKFSLVQLCGRTTDKADALAYVLAERGLNFDSVAAIGDDVNDIEMLRRAGIGIAMENALDEVKAAADWITAAADNDGVAAAIDRLLQAHLAAPSAAGAAGRANPASAAAPESPATTANHYVATEPIFEPPHTA